MLSIRWIALNDGGLSNLFSLLASLFILTLVNIFIYSAGTIVSYFGKYWHNYRLPDDRKPSFLEYFWYDFLSGWKILVKHSIWAFLISLMALGVFYIVTVYFHLPWISSIRSAFFSNYYGSESKFEFDLLSIGLTLFFLGLLFSFVVSFVIAQLAHSIEPAVNFFRAVKLFGGWIFLGMAGVLFLLSVFGAIQFPILVIAPVFFLTLLAMIVFQAYRHRRRAKIAPAKEISPGKDLLS